MESNFKIGDKVCYADGHPMKGASYENLSYKIVRDIQKEVCLTKVYYECGGWDAAHTLKHYEEPVYCGFQKGDRVCKKSGRDFSNGLKVCTVDYVTTTNRVYLEESGRWVSAEQLCLTSEETKPHKYAEFIIGWAQGKVVQRRTSTNGDWYDVSSENCYWSCNEDVEYRFKPDENELRKMEIEEQIEKLQKELAELEGGC